MPTTVTTLRLEGYLSPSLNKWQRMHWRARQSALKTCRNYIRFALMDSEDPDLQFTGPVRVAYLRIRRAGPKMDDDNLFASFKVIGDALEREGVVLNDSQIKLGVAQKVARKGDRWGTILTFEEIVT